MEVDDYASGLTTAQKQKVVAAIANASDLDKISKLQTMLEKNEYDEALLNQLVQQ
jgi:hypothetical protein